MSNAILLALAPAFFVMALGFGAGKLRVVDEKQVIGLNALVMDFALPASLFVATASAARTEMFSQAPLFGILGLVMLLIYVAWVVLLRKTSKTSTADASVQALTIAFPNFAGVGLPIASAIVGPTGTVPVAVAIAAGSILISPLALVAAEMNAPATARVAKSTSAQIMVAIRRSLTKPVVLAPTLGIVLSLSGLQLGRVVDACLTLIGQTAAGVALFLTGLILSAQSFRLDWKVTAATALSNIVRPLLTCAVVFLLPVSGESAKLAILLASMPSGFFGILFAVNYRLDSAAAGSIVIATTALSVVTMAIAIAVLFPH